MRHERGFVMADTLIALVIASLLMTGLVSANMTGLRAAQTAEQKLTATYLARALAIDPLSEPSGKRTIAGTTYAWTIAVEPSGRLGPRGPMISDRHVDVTWSGQNTVQTVTVETALAEAVP